MGENVQAEMEGDGEEVTTPKSVRDPKLVALEQDWKQDIINEHMVFITGIEVTYQEFKEILLELALKLQDQIDSQPGKLKSLMKKFLDDYFLKRLRPYIKFTTSKTPVVAEEKPVRKWP